ncbi:MAG: hypothetical protein U1F40_06180 [Turneriella sp.]
MLPGKKVSEFNFEALQDYLANVFVIRYTDLEEELRAKSKDEFIAEIREKALQALTPKSRNRIRKHAHSREDDRAAGNRPEVERSPLPDGPAA